MRRMALLVVVVALVVTAMMVGAGPASARDNGGISINGGNVGNGGNSSNFENVGGAILSGNNGIFFGSGDFDDDFGFGGFGDFGGGTFIGI